MLIIIELILAKELVLLKVTAIKKDIVIVGGVAYRCIIYNIRISETINLTKEYVLENHEYI